MTRLAYLSIIFGVLVVSFSAWGVVIPSIEHLKEYKKLESFSHLADLRFARRFRIFSILSGISEIIFVISMYLYLGYGHIEVLILFIISSFGLIGCGIFSYKKVRILHNISSYVYFIGSIIAVFLIGLSTLNSNYLLFSIVSIIIPVLVISIAVFLIVRRGKKTLFEEFLHTLSIYFWVGVFVMSLILTK